MEPESIAPFMLNGVRHRADCRCLNTPAGEVARRPCNCGALLREIETLRAAMWKYGKHLSACTIHTVRVPAFSCSCGWLQIRETLAGEARRPEAPPLFSAGEAK